MNTKVKFAGTHYKIWCPACNEPHIFVVNPTNPDAWGFNNNMNNPTVEGSIKVSGFEYSKITICHSHIKDGMIQFLKDCTHELRNKTVELPDYPSNDAKD